MLKSRMRYDDTDRSQAAPALYGATLNIREATPRDLPPGCAWITADSIEAATIQIQKKIIAGPFSSAIWVPPDTGNYKMARDFFAASLGKIYSPSWHFNIKKNDPENPDQPVANFGFTGGFQRSKKFNPDFYNAARNEIIGWKDAFFKITTASKIQNFAESARRYNAHPNSYCIHADGKPGKSKALRILTPWFGDAPFFYDHRELTLMKGRSKQEGALVFKPLNEQITAWNPPPRAIIVLTCGGWDKKHLATHSAKGTDYATEPAGRAVTITNLFFNP